MHTRCWTGFMACAMALVLGAGCGKQDDTNTSSAQSSNTRPRANHIQEFHIVAGSENESLEPILKAFSRSQGVDLQIHYRGSVDIMLELEQGIQMNADAVWPANSLWVMLGDVHKVVKHEQSIMRSPVVFGVKRSVVNRLGWMDRDVTVADILAAAEGGNFRFAMTSATQSNSGAAAYFGFLYAVAGAPEVLTHEHLQRADVQEKTSRLLKRIHRSSGSSGWLKDLVVAQYDEFDAMVNYEAMIIEANQELEKNGREPLITIYPVDGITMADSPLGYINKGEEAKEAFFHALVAYLKTPEVQDQIMRAGRRTGLVFDPGNVDASVFRSEWGIDVARVISPVPTPSEPVLREALHLYQSGGLRKPSATVYVLDFSGSMEGNGEQQLKKAMALLLDPAQSRRYMLQPSPRDLHIVIPFDAVPRPVLNATGNDPAVLQDLLNRINAMASSGGTDIYQSTAKAMQALRDIPDLDDYFPAVILMSDGQSQGNASLIAAEVKQNKAAGKTIPVFAILFGQADETQMSQVAESASGRVFHGKKDLAKAFRNAKGYN